MEKFVPASPDALLKKDADMTLAKFGHINKIVDVINTISENVYPDNATAVTAGLEVGTLYSTATGEVRIVV
jgi:hypothetical protein